ncbi:Type IIS restriction enzyme Eco57I [Capnocytophaga ochracea]|uniref:site-specific DNA-methyltransferase (adenine-specific) n=1 Tax=Capnocytophaga ochracea TaxID=1018 RepID=A0A2X2R771_CAPOC|nr:N-6 DNA methylase [Capnocytophaga ochracea]SQA76946.1 Type IIS restriction enzyme Eco57I [Capnocytophaga ochracea]
MKNLRQILSSPYHQEDWISFLKELFAHNSGTGVILQKPQRIELPKSEKVREAYELGSYETTEGRLIGIYQVNISEDMLLYRNKVGLRQLMKNIYKYNVDGVLVVFVQEKKWRLSYISEIIKEVDEKGKIIKEITNEKRFTYLLGEGEKTKTAADRLQLLVGKELSLEDFKNAFAVEALNNDFFDRYKDIYEDFVQHITGVRYEKKGNKYIENKKHQPHPNFDGYKDYKDYPMPHPDSETKLFKNREFQNLFRGNEKAVRDFVKRMMGRIVFLYFIQKKGWLAVPKGKNWGEGNYDYLYQLYKETPREDQPYFYEKRLAPLFFECFTDKKSESETNDLRFPYLNGGLFDKTQDQHFDKVNLPYSIFTELFDTFNSYNFTVYEDAPNEHTVAVDPEMLGHIFENLLEDNKDKGAFYTPKEIVHYMCKESLKISLLSKIVPDNNQSEKAKDVITKIIEHQPLNEDEKSYVKEKGNIITTSLENVKICDPAIGSGAFPMGLLQEIYYIKITLQQLGITPEQTDAQIKKYIIEKNIYGVDIDAGAVDIARLRFWLSLVVDEQLPQPLPNLDFKIMQGNSLLESYQGVDLSELTKVKSEKEAGAQITIFDEMLDVHRNDLSNYIKRYFSCTNSKEKITIRKEIDKNIRQQINQSYPKIDMTNIDICANPYFFLWHTYFADVFKGANNLDNPGFDIVIGNPPYGAKLSQEDKEVLKKKYISAQTIKGAQKGSLNTYTLFIELGYNILRKDGCLSFIVPISITSSDSVSGIHKLLENNCQEIKFSSYAVRPKPVFKNAVVNTSILQFIKTKTSCKRIYATKMYRRGKKFSLENLINNLEFTEVKDFKLIGRIPKISYEIEKNILQKIFSKQKVSAFMRKKGTPIYYRSAGGRYFKVVTNYSTKSSSETKILLESKIADSIGCILSSSLSFWFYQIYSDNLSWKSYEIENFTIPYLSDKDIVALEKLYQKYLADIENNAKNRTVTEDSSYHISEFKEYKIQKSKHIIDQIDDLICPLYGLTQEEIDFIKNYEIEFRLSDND